MLDKDEYKEVAEFLTLMVDGETYGIDVTTIMEVIRVPDIAPVSGSNEIVLGIINLRGKIITIIDSRKKFCVFEKPLDIDSRIIIIQEHDNLIGILVDSIIEVLKVLKEDIKQYPNVSKRSLGQIFEGIYSKNKHFVIIFNALKLFETESEY